MSRDHGGAWTRPYSRPVWENPVAVSMTELRAGADTIDKRFRQLGRCLAAHRLLAVLLGVAVGLRVAVAIAYRPALFFFGDSWDYVRMAYKNALLVGGSPVRPSGYPLV